jgi:hypothetical protein
MDELPPAASADAAPASAPAPSSAASGDAPGVKECVFCGSMIPSWADRCSQCAGFLPIAEGRAFSQHFFFFVACLAMFIGTLLPWEGAWYDSYGFRSLAGGFLLVFSGYGMVAAFFNIFHRQMIVWPAIFAALDGVIFGWQRVAQILASPEAKAISWAGSELATKKKALLQTLDLFGPGLILVCVFSSLFWLVFVMGVVQGGRASAARKDAERAARAARKK